MLAQLPTSLFLSVAHFFNTTERALVRDVCLVWSQVLTSSLAEKWFNLPAPPKLVREHFAFYEPFALNGHPFAQAQVAFYHLTCSRSKEEALKWANLSAEQGEPDGWAIQGICKMHLNPDNPGEEAEKAMPKFRRAAAAGAILVACKCVSFETPLKCWKSRLETKERMMNVRHFGITRKGEIF